ncbi:maturation of 5S rRNA [Knufia fluminis]|uniref:Maturation of 5S rRNA n=1 Tax=Knufia fluminis TaxID=191047 RepID=A0AAN8EW14_9EURO|nr:maturation of 5S rRNA [Knufia fluminis]
MAQCPSNEYAILSHTWHDDKVNFDEFQSGRSRDKQGFWKIQQCCKQAKGEGLRYAWVDTCCIDKRSSAELSEAINSMFNWYKSARICYVYMEDVGITLDGDVLIEVISKSRWFTRGWTLQELLAPQSVSFYDAEWNALGSKHELSRMVAQSSGVDVDLLTGIRQIDEYSIAQRMSWASTRKTTRIEDAAYSLLGIFDVNMPLLYGEGTKAFLRLQEMIIQRTDDETIFAWTGVDPAGSGLLASSPAQFSEGGKIERDDLGEERPPYSVTNRGLAIQLKLMPYTMNTYMAPLSCCRRYNAKSYQLKIFLGRTTADSQYRRVRVHGRDLAEPIKHPFKFFRRFYNDGWSQRNAQTVLLYVPNVSRWSLAFAAGEPILHFSWTTSESYYGHFSPRVNTTVAIQDLQNGVSICFQNFLPQRLPPRWLRLGFDRSFRPVCFLSSLNSPQSVEDHCAAISFWSCSSYSPLLETVAGNEAPDGVFAGYPEDLRFKHATKHEIDSSDIRAVRGHRLQGLIATFTEETDDASVDIELRMVPRRDPETANDIQWNVALAEKYVYRSNEAALGHSPRTT